MAFYKPKKVIESSQQGAYLHALRLLARQDYSHQKLAQKLKEKGFLPEHSEEAINELFSKNYLSNDRYLESKTKQLAHKGYSKDHIRRALEQENLDVTFEKIDEIFLEIGLTEDEQITKLIEKKRPQAQWSDSSPEAYKLKSKAISYALQKGHDYGSIKRVLGVILHQLDAEI